MVPNGGHKSEVLSPGFHDPRDADVHLERDAFGDEYRRALGVKRPPPEQLGTVLVDLKRRVSAAAEGREYVRE